jgi:hypothetical protein
MAHWVLYHGQARYERTHLLWAWRRPLPLSSHFEAEGAHSGEAEGEWVGKIGSGAIEEAHFHHGTTYGVTQRTYAQYPISENAAVPNTAAAAGAPKAIAITTRPLKSVQTSMVICLCLL